MKKVQMKYVVLLISALSAVLPLAAEETTVTSWSAFRSAVKNSRCAEMRPISPSR